MEQSLLLICVGYIVIATVLVTLGCYNKQHRLGDVNNKYLVFTVLEAGNSRSRCRQIWCLVRAHLLVCRWLSSCILTWPQEVTLLIRALILFITVLPSWPNYLPHWGWGLQHELWGTYCTTYERLQHEITVIWSQFVPRITLPNTNTFCREIALVAWLLSIYYLNIYHSIRVHVLFHEKGRSCDS